MISGDDPYLLLGSNFLNYWIFWKNFDPFNFGSRELELGPTCDPTLYNVVIVRVNFSNLAPFMRNGSGSLEE